MADLYERFSEQLGRSDDEGDEHPSRSPVANGRGMFEANAQSFRIVTQLEPNVAVDDRWCGLDLTRTTLKAILKYPKTEFEAERAGEEKFCIYDEEPDLEVYDWLFDEPRDERE